jgi:AAA+ superfamily predicted ATPase
VEIGLGASLPGRAVSWIPFVLPAPTLDMRQHIWRDLLSQGEPAIGNPDAVATGVAAAFQLTHSQIQQAWSAASGLARRRNVFIPSIEIEDLYEACRRQSTRQLVAFATRVEPRRELELDDVVLPELNRRQLAELQVRIRNRGRIFSAMGLGDRMRLGRGITALFIGASGTGKTMAAEVLASEQGVDLFVVDIASIVSKWVGETERHLSRLFADAEKANCMLFFDEADSMFGQRGEIKEGHDRWANLEVNYLLQRIEEFSGVVILATNFRQNIDEAFQRRIHVVVEFPSPDAASRREIWRRLLPGPHHCALAAADFDELAARFELSGGSVRNISIDACYRSLAAQSTTIQLRDVIASTAREYQKFGRPVTRGEFGQKFFEWAMQDVIAPAESERSA